MSHFRNVAKTGSLLVAVFALVAEAAPQLEEVIVTAQKREQNLQDVPMAITALGRELLNDNEINNVQDLTKLVPSMRFTPGDDPTNSAIRIRGVGTDVYSVAVEPNVSVVVDEVPLARTSLANFEFADLERIEVLRGPQGTLFGKNSTAGLVHVITRDPSPEFEAFSRFSYEAPQNFPGQLMKAQVGVSGPLTDTLGLRLTGFAKTVDGHLVDVAQSDDTLPDSESYGLRSKLRWDPSDALSIRFSMEYQDTDAQSTPITFRYANDEKAARSPEIEYGKDNRQTKTIGTNQADSINQAASIIVNWDLGSHVLTSVTAWRGYEIVRDLSIPDLDGERVDLVRNGGERAIETLTQELRLNSTGNGAFEYTVGALWFDNRLTNTFERGVEDIPSNSVVQALVPGAPDLPPEFAVIPGESYSQEGFRKAAADTKNLGVFAQATWHPTEDWHLTLGARYIHEELTASGASDAATIHDASGTRISQAQTSVPATTITDETVIGTFSLGYDWSGDSRLYATLSTGYRGGAFDMAASDLESAFADPVKPETVQSIELGAKTRLWDNRLELNVAVFQSVFKDFQAQIVDVARSDDLTALVPSAQFRMDNAGELETKGVEIDFKAQPLESLFMYGSILYNKAEFNEFATQCFVGQEPGENGGVDVDGDGTCDVQDVSGGRLPNAPEFSVSLTARYEHNFNDYANRAYLQLGGRWLDDIQFSAEQHPLAVQESYSVWDLRMGWYGMQDRLEISAYVKNLFAQSYVVGFFPLSLENDRRDIAHFLPMDADRIAGISVQYGW